MLARVLFTRNMTFFIELRHRRYDDESGLSLMGDKSES
jgi:hypothetical protein